MSHLTSLSDHCRIKISLDVDFNVEIHSDNINTETPPLRYKWVSPYKENFENLLNSKEVKNLFTMLSIKNILLHRRGYTLQLMNLVLH